MPLADTSIDPAGGTADASVRTLAAFRVPLDEAAHHCLELLSEPSWDRSRAMRQFARDRVIAVPDMLATITRAARILGDRWVADTCSFGDVTIGLHRLTLLLIDLEALPDPGRERLHGGTVLLAAAPDDQHSFGLATVAFSLRRAGWDVTVDLSGEPDAVARQATRGFDCIGLSVGHDRAVAPATALVGRIRRAAGRRGTTIAVGGPMLLRDPSLATSVGADIAAADGAALVHQLRRLRPARAA